MILPSSKQRFLLYTGNIGAGGYWSFEHETPDPTMEMQAGPFHCFAACAATILQRPDIVVPQTQIANAVGVPTRWSGTMTDMLNKHDPHFLWTRGWFDPEYSVEAAAFLRTRLPAILFFKDFGNKYLHAVILNAIDPQQRWAIRDPWNTNGQATRYFMRPNDLCNARHGWTGFAVFTEKRRTKSSPRRK